MNKTIHINPDLFKLGGTRKKTLGPKNISIKNRTESVNKTLSKRNALLKFIRRHQDSNHKQNNNNHNTHIDNDFQGTDDDFENSLQYLMDITNNDNNNYTTINNDKTHEQVNMNFPENSNSQPQYGCLKNGNLPTYRQFHCKKTLKNRSEVVNTNIEPDGSDYLGKVDSFDDNHVPKITEYTDIVDDMEPENRKHGDIQPTQRKVLKRTFKIGKSNTERKISVLVSNKTIRHQSSNKSVSLKKTPLNDVRRYLVKRGFVKIGTTAPPDVLRKMYESASMVCGDVTNHNPETLMYNFINSEKKSW